MIHPQETVLERLKYRDIDVEIVQWRETIWCGRIGYAQNNTDEPDVDAIAQSYPKAEIKNREVGWDACISLNYLSSERPNAVMFAVQTDSEEQEECFDLYRSPSGTFMRIQICKRTAAALERKMWEGGIPPYEWIYDQIAPELGYAAGDDRMPIVEYYGCYNAEWIPQCCRLYVPIQKIGNC